MVIFLLNKMREYLLIDFIRLLYSTFDTGARLTGSLRTKSR